MSHMGRSQQCGAIKVSMLTAAVLVWVTWLATYWVICCGDGAASPQSPPILAERWQVQGRGAPTPVRSGDDEQDAGATTARIERRTSANSSVQVHDRRKRPPTAAEKADFATRSRDVIATLRNALTKHEQGSPNHVRMSCQVLSNELALRHVDEMFVSEASFASDEEFFYFGRILPYRDGREGGTIGYVKLSLREHPELARSFQQRDAARKQSELDEYSRWMARPELERIQLVAKARAATETLAELDKEWQELKNVRQGDPRWVRKEQVRVQRDRAQLTNGAIPNSVNRSTGAWEFRYQ